jgi:hypothetical protein
MPYTDRWKSLFQPFLEFFQIVFILDPFFDKTALGANELAQPDIEAGQVDGYTAPAVKHRRTSFAADGG